jgi:hypothetical protein
MRALLAMVALAACGEFGPSWTVDLFVPIRYPDVQLVDYAIGGVIPPVDLSFTSPQESQDMSGIIDQVLSSDLVGVEAEVLFATPSNVSGQIEVSVAPIAANLFSTNPNLAFTVTVPVRVTAGDTIASTIPVALLQTAQGEAVPTLFYQTRGTLRGAGGAGTTVGVNDILSLGVNLVLTVLVNDSTP